ncbi:MAG: hypothetical protein U9N34_04020 [Candidatus Cloacimonadota bacterium]|nr:hypothetical protein [Candidatus Cloacimonadota bacterium]
MNNSIYGTLTEEQKTKVNYMMHNFGDRGSSSVESAGIGGMGQLAAGFMGTDNFNTLRYVKMAYNTPEIGTIGHSIPATEHSSTTSWTRENEMDMIMNHLEMNKGKAIIAAVMDSYDYFKAVRIVCDQNGEFQKKINTDEYPVFVMRPDSGNPADIIPETLKIMEEENVPFIVNNKGYKVFNKMRIIWGDGINTESINIMLDIMVEMGYSSENIAFGSGGWLMQQHDRDTQGWAVKCSSITVAEDIKEDHGEEDGYRKILIDRDVFKDPITAPGKKSKRGKITTYFNKATNVYFTDKVGLDFDNGAFDIMETVYENGEMVKEYTFAEVRTNNA